MKVIFTVHSYYPMKDGVSTVTTYMAEGLAKKGHEVIVVTPGYRNAKEEEHNGVTIRRVEIYNIHTIYRGDKVAYQKMMKDLTKDADALICVCMQTPTTEFLYPIFDEIKCKKILYMHGMIEFRFDRLSFASFSAFVHRLWNIVRYKIGAEINRKYFAQYEHVIQLYEEDYATKYFKKHYGIDSEIIGNAADDVFFKNVDKKPETGKYAICVANYLEGKNQEMLIRAIYKAQTSGLKLVLIGSEETPYLKKLEALNKKFADKAGENRVELLVRVTREETVEYIRNAAMYLFGSKGEKFPMAIVEAIVSGVPYISTDVGCVRMLPGGVISNTVTEMAYWIDKFMDDEMIRMKYGAEGYSYGQENLTIGPKVDKLEEIIRRGKI